MNLLTALATSAGLGAVFYVIMHAAARGIPEANWLMRIGALGAGLVFMVAMLAAVTREPALQSHLGIQAPGTLATTGDETSVGQTVIVPLEPDSLSEARPRGGGIALEDGTTVLSAPVIALTLAAFSALGALGAAVGAWRSARATRTAVEAQLFANFMEAYEGPEMQSLLRTLRPIFTSSASSSRSWSRPGAAASAGALAVQASVHPSAASVTVGHRTASHAASVANRTVTEHAAHSIAPRLPRRTDAMVPAEPPAPGRTEAGPDTEADLAPPDPRPARTPTASA